MSVANSKEIRSGFEMAVLECQWRSFLSLSDALFEIEIFPKHPFQYKIQCFIFWKKKKWCGIWRPGYGYQNQTEWAKNYFLTIVYTKYHFLLLLLNIINYFLFHLFYYSFWGRVGERKLLEEKRKIVYQHILYIFFSCILKINDIF